MASSSRHEAWLQTRKVGFASFVVPVFLVCYMILTSNGQVSAALSDINNSKAWSSTLQYFYIWFIVEVFLNLFKYVLCVEVFSMSTKHYSLIIGRRDGWSTSEIEMLEKTYSMKKLKVMDAIYRRAGHIIVNFWRIYYYVYLIHDQKLRLQVAILQLPIIFTIKKCTEFHWTGNFVYQGCRIRDGQYGRFNQVVVNFWAYCARIIMMTLLVDRNFDEQTNKVLLALAMQPLIWGDTFGEVIGSFFGRREFEVRGIGEINKKTVEGTVAVFLSSFFSLIVTFHYLVAEGAALNFRFNPYVVFFYTAFVCMIVEVGAFRGTDNFFLQTVGLGLLLHSMA